MAALPVVAAAALGGGAAGGSEVEVTPSQQHPLQAPDLLLGILGYVVDPECRDLRAGLCVCSTWDAVGKGDLIWEAACRTSFNLTRKVKPTVGNVTKVEEDPEQVDADGNSVMITTEQEQPVGPGTEDVGSFYAAWQSWEALQKSLELQPGELDASLWIRAQSVWYRLERWYGQHHKPIGDTFGPGVTPAQWRNALELACGSDVAAEVARYPSMRALQYLYSRHDGQNLQAPRSQMGDIFKGMFGGYSAYDHLICLTLLSLDRSVKYGTNLLRSSLITPGSLVVAADFRAGKVIVLEPRAGDLMVLTRSGSVPACPVGGGECVLPWLETFASRLEAGVYGVGPLVPDVPQTVGLNLFPLKGPEVSCAITRGIRVTASSIFVPEHTQGWVYSIRIRLLTPGEDGYVPAETRGFITAQLRSRHWEIHDGHGNVSHVRGPGVIGKYPLLSEGGWRDDEDSGAGSVLEGEERKGEFIYQSCSGRSPGGHASFGGELIFAPGSLEQPRGQDFEVKVERFPLRMPDFIY